VQAKTSAEEWQKRLARWRESGLTAEQFASEIGINAGTLKFWRYKVNKAARGTPQTRRPVKVAAPAPPAFVEVRAASSETRFEIDLANGRRLRVPAAFDSSALERLVAVLERT
jgi:transposase-like protein